LNTHFVFGLLVLGNELLRVRDGLRGVGGVVENDPVDLLAADRRRQELERVLFGDAERRGGAGRGQRDADVDVGLRWAGGPGDPQRGNERRQQFADVHEISS
jgi:hypothetical protein